MDFHVKTYLEGGPTIKQVYALFENIQKSKNYELKFMAGVHGVELKGDAGESKPDVKSNLKSTVPFFGDPEEYKDLSEDEKEDMTKKMLQKHKLWSQGGLLNG